MDSPSKYALQYILKVSIWQNITKEILQYNNNNNSLQYVKSKKIFLLYGKKSTEYNKLIIITTE